MTLYLLRDESVVPSSSRWPNGCTREDRFFRARRALLSGPFAVVGPLGRSPRGRLARGGPVPSRRRGSMWWSGRRVDGEELVEHAGVAGAWQFTDAEHDRTITVAFVDGDLWQASASIGTGGAESPEWAGPLERVDAFRWDWFATLTPQ